MPNLDTPRGRHDGDRIRGGGVGWWWRRRGWWGRWGRRRLALDRPPDRRAERPIGRVARDGLRIRITHRVIPGRIARDGAITHEEAIRQWGAIGIDGVDREDDALPNPEGQCGITGAESLDDRGALTGWWGWLVEVTRRRTDQHNDGSSLHDVHQTSGHDSSRSSDRLAGSRSFRDVQHKDTTAKGLLPGECQIG
jgi:hypothetical protein